MLHVLEVVRGQADVMRADTGLHVVLGLLALSVLVRDRREGACACLVDTRVFHRNYISGTGLGT